MVLVPEVAADHHQSLCGLADVRKRLAAAQIFARVPCLLVSSSHCFLTLLFPSLDYEFLKLSVNPQDLTSST